MGSVIEELETIDADIESKSPETLGGARRASVISTYTPSQDKLTIQIPHPLELEMNKLKSEIPLSPGLPSPASSKKGSLINTARDSDSGEETIINGMRLTRRSAARQYDAYDMFYK